MRRLAAAFLIAGLAIAADRHGERPAYLNPSDLVVAEQAGRAYVALSGVDAVAVVDLEAEQRLTSWPLPGAPHGLALSADEQRLVVALGETDGELIVIDTATGREVRRFPAGFSPRAPVLIGDLVAVCHRFEDVVRFYGLDDGRLRGQVAVSREPIAAVASADGARLFVACHLPAQTATADHVAAAIDVIDVERARRIGRIDLPNGSSGLRELAITPDGRTVFATHVIGHYQVPTTQLERGWMNANALTVIDVERAERLATVLLDDVTLGAANPWGVTVTGDGRDLLVAHHGTHELSRIPLELLMKIVRRGQIDDGAAGGTAYAPGLEHELRTMNAAGRARIALAGEGPRVVAAYRSRALVAEYFSGTLAVVDLDVEAPAVRPRQIALGPEPAMDTIRRGELRFHDARLCFQQWQSCMSCHPDIRTDALNWDLLNDGAGNPKQTKSMLLAHETPPAMALGVRARAEVAVRAGIRFIQFAQVDDREAAAIDAFLRSLEPLPSPRLDDGQLTAEALRGKAIFERLQCQACHAGPHFTDGQSYEVGHATGMDRGREFDTPTLIEVWRTGPYLYDGRSATMSEALRIHRAELAEPDGEPIQPLSPEEMEALVEYVLSL